MAAKGKDGGGCSNGRKRRRGLRVLGFLAPVSAPRQTGTRGQNRKRRRKCETVHFFFVQESFVAKSKDMGLVQLREKCHRSFLRSPEQWPNVAMLNK